jgi:hypothetical protein
MLVTVRRLLTGSLVAITMVLALNVADASAADLLVLNGDPPVTLSGAQSYGIVYVDGELRLTGDTQINASSIYIGPDAEIDSCYVPGTGDGQCTAGRSLTLSSAGPLTVATGVDLQSGATNGPGGNLSLTGTSVAVGGLINTSGDTGFGSGTVTISSSGPIATQGITAPGADVSISGPGPILVGGALQTQGAHGATPGDPLTRMQAGGPISISATGHGDVDVDGAITAQGQSAPGAGGSGGAGGTVTISGTNVSSESITTFGGNSQEAGSGPGPSGPVSMTASGVLAVSGAIDTSGAAGAGGSGATGAAVNLKAGGVLSVGAIDASGGQSVQGGSITISGTSVAAGDLNASGGGGSNADRNGAYAAPISVTAPNGATLGALLAVGGNSDGIQSSPAVAGQGAGITVVSSAGSISAGRVEAEGGSQGTGPGANGGAIDLNATDDLSVAGDVRTDGSDAGGSSAPPWLGGNAGRLFLAADTGTLSIGGNASAQGGTGSGNSAGGQLGGTGGAGGQVTLIAHAIGLLTSLSAAGGSGGGNGDQQGPGGPGGTLTAYTNAQIFNSQQLVSTDGGDGNPTGPAGNQVQNSSPASLATTASGILSFTSHSPGATHFLLETVGKGGALKTVEKTSKTTGLLPPTPVCQKVSLEVVAVTPAVAWTSDPATPISYTRQPSKTQTCAAPPKLRLPAKLDSTVARARHAHWVETLRFHSSGIGAVRAMLSYRSLSSHHATVTAKLTITKAGTHVLTLKLPPAVRAAGSGSVKVTETSPDGSRHSTHTVKVAVSA